MQKQKHFNSIEPPADCRFIIQACFSELFDISECGLTNNQPITN